MMAGLTQRLTGGALATVLALIAMPAAASAATAGPAAVTTWGAAVHLPGIAALGSGARTTISAMSCPSEGNCVVVGSYTLGSDHLHSYAYVASEVSGTWGNVEQLPGTASRDGGYGPYPQAVSCGSAGNCAVVGAYTGGAGHQQAFVTDEVGGTWHKAAEIPGITALEARIGPVHHNAEVQAVSCGSAGNCAAVGNFNTYGVTRSHVFVANEVSGTWHKAAEITGSGLYAESNANAWAVSCPSAGNCVAGGDGYGHQWGSSSAMVVREINGTWHKSMNLTGKAEGRILSVSCPSAGNCGVSGYRNNVDGSQALVANEVNGAWRKAHYIPGLKAVEEGNGSEALSVSCTSARNCTAGGYYGKRQDDVHTYAFAAREVGGTWHKATEIGGTESLGLKRESQVAAVSCTSSGNCGLLGFYYLRSGLQVFVASESGGSFKSAIKLPGVTGPDADSAALACLPGNCIAAGNDSQAYVASQH